MNYFQYKLNLSPKIISTYVPNDADIKENWYKLKYQVIPSALALIFGIENVVKTESYLRVQLIFNQEELYNSEEYKFFKKSSASLEQEYFEVIEKYSKSGNITWTQEFLKVTKINSKKGIRILQRKFPFILMAENEIKNNEVEIDLENTNDFGHGRKYLIQSRKIEKFLKEFDLSTYNLDFFYTFSDEFIYIPEKYGIDKSLAMMENVEALLFANGSRTNIGRAKINPVVDNIEVDKKVAKAELTFVYPNGAKQADERFAILNPIVKAHAQTQKVTLSAEKGSTLSSSGIEDIVSGPASKGYFKSGKTPGGKSLIKLIPRSVKKIFHL